MRMKWIRIAILEWTTPVRAEGESRDVGEQRCWRPWTTKEPCVEVSTQGAVLPVVAILRYGWQGRLTSGRRNLTATSDAGPDKRDELWGARLAF